jgi:hypothetical protein
MSAKHADGTNPQVDEFQPKCELKYDRDPA